MRSAARCRESTLLPPYQLRRSSPLYPCATQGMRRILSIGCAGGTIVDTAVRICGCGEHKTWRRGNLPRRHTP